jgi:hypothetical protein
MFQFALPALAAAEGILQGSTILRFVNIALGVVAAGIDVAGKLSDLNGKVQQFVDEHRDPSEAEWAELVGRSDAAHETIQRA